MSNRYVVMRSFPLFCGRAPSPRLQHEAAKRERSFGEICDTSRIVRALEYYYTNELLFSSMHAMSISVDDPTTISLFFSLTRFTPTTPTKLQNSFSSQRRANNKLEVSHKLKNGWNSNFGDSPVFTFNLSLAVTMDDLNSKWIGQRKSDEKIYKLIILSAERKCGDKTSEMTTIWKTVAVGKKESLLTVAEKRLN